MKYKNFYIAIILSVILMLSGCNQSNMPFNGDITFHSLSLTIAEKYIRDSTQSTEDVWFFEHGFYKECIILLRQDAEEDSAAVMEEYAEYLTGMGVTAEFTTFLDREAVLSSCTMDGIYCQELAFTYDGSLYAASLRGGDEESFEALISTIRLTEESGS